MLRLAAPIVCFPSLAPLRLPSRGLLPFLQLVNCGLSPATVDNLEQKGISALFPIQKHVFEPVMAGRDLIGRARTGSGKTLAFALPVIENLVKARLCYPLCTSWYLASTLIRS